MRHLISFYLVAVCCSSVVLFSCTKTGAGTANTQQDILMNHKWQHYQTHTIVVDIATQAVLKDTMVQVEPCYQNSTYVFAADSVIRRTLYCLSPNNVNEGRWYLKADSTFSGSILIRSSYGTGWIYNDFGLPYGKMKLLTDTAFQLSSQSSFGFYPGYPVINYNTLYLRAVN